MLKYLLGSTSTFNYNERMYGEDTTYIEDITQASKNWMPEGPWWDEPLMDLNEEGKVNIRVWDAGAYKLEFWALRMPDGYWNGYVQINDKDHPLYGIEYTKIEMKVIVHGGLTHSRDNGEGWVFGFDTHHTCDFSPTNRFAKYNPPNGIEEFDFRSPLYRTHEFVLKECWDLATQIDSFREEDIDHGAELITDSDFE